MSISIIRTKWWDNSDKDLEENYHSISLLLSAGWNELPDIEGKKAIKAIDELLTEAPKGSKWKITISNLESNIIETQSISFTRIKWWDESGDKDLLEQYYRINLLFTEGKENGVTREEIINSIKAINKVVHKSPIESKWKITISKED